MAAFEDTGVYGAGEKQRGREKSELVLTVNNGEERTRKEQNPRLVHLVVAARREVARC